MEEKKKKLKELLMILAEVSYEAEKLADSILMSEIKDKNVDSDVTDNMILLVSELQRLSHRLRKYRKNEDDTVIIAFNRKDVMKILREFKREIEIKHGNKVYIYDPRDPEFFEEHDKKNIDFLGYDEVDKELLIKALKTILQRVKF